MFDIIAWPWNPFQLPLQGSQRTAAPPGWSVDLPSGGLRPGLNHILVGWTAEPFRQPRPVYMPILVVPADNPPFGRPDPKLWTIVASWQPDPHRPPLALYLPTGLPTILRGPIARFRRANFTALFSVRMKP